MRILHVTNTYLPVRNGVTVSVAGWVDAQRSAGHHVAVWTVGRGHSSEDVHVTRGAGSLANGFPVPLSLSPPEALRRERWDVVHIHHPVLLGKAGLRFGRSIGAAVVATAHSDYLAYLDPYTGLAAYALRAPAVYAMRSLFGRVDTVFAMSTDIGRTLRGWGVWTPTKVAPYPVDPQRLGPLPRDEARRMLGVSQQAPIAVFAGRLALDKRPIRLVEEFVKGTQGMPGARLCLIGDGPLYERVRSAAKASDGKVLIMGELRDRELGTWYSAADLFASASPNEVGPLTTIEAAVCATPTVGYSAPGFRDRVLDGITGRLVPDAPGQLAAGIGELLGQRDLAHAMGSDARTHLAAHSPSESAAALLEGYRAAQQVALEVRTARRRRSRPLRADPID